MSPHSVAMVTEFDDLSIMKRFHPIAVNMPNIDLIYS